MVLSGPNRNIVSQSSIYKSLLLLSLPSWPVVESINTALPPPLTTAQCTVYSEQGTVYSVQCTVYTVQCTVYSVHCTPELPPRPRPGARLAATDCREEGRRPPFDPRHCTLFTVHCTLYTVYFKLYIVYCTLYTVHCTLYNIYFMLYTVYCTLYTKHCSLYTVEDCLRAPLYIDSAPVCARPLPTNGEPWKRGQKKFEFPIAPHCPRDRFTCSRN